MLVGLPLLAWYLIWRRVRRSEIDLRAGLIISAIIWATSLVVITELDGQFSAINRTGLAISWLAVCAIVLVLPNRRQPVIQIEPSLTVAPQTGDRWTRALAVIIGAEIGVLLVIALVAPPNTWDAMTYHMSRVMHWMQNRSVQHYPTHILRQIHLNPGAEFIILHLQVLWGGDRLANLPQWMAMTGSIIVVTLIARNCGAGATGQVLAAAFCVSLPMGILQSTGAQNDYVAALWLACAVWIVSEIRGGAVGRQWDVLFAMALGLAILTKATCMLFGLAIVIWFGIQKLAATHRARALSSGFMIVVGMVIVINASHWTRNFRVFGNILGPAEEVAAYRNASFAPKLLLSNCLRNLTLHVNIGSEEFCKTVSDSVENSQV